jgi:hypothetical protein
MDDLGKIRVISEARALTRHLRQLQGSRNGHAANHCTEAETMTLKTPIFPSP